MGWLLGKNARPNFYIVHFNRQPGVADAAFENHTEQFLNNLYRTNQWLHPKLELGPGMNLVNMALDPRCSMVYLAIRL